MLQKDILLGRNIHEDHLSPLEFEFLEKVQLFVKDEVLPSTRDWENAKSFPDNIWTKLGSLGLLSMSIPDKKGIVCSCKAYVEACRILAHGDPALAMNVAAWNALSASHIVHLATQEQRDKYLDKIATGDVKLAWALTEPDAGSDARRVRTSASFIQEKPGYAKLNGQKMFITNGGKADLIVVIARISETELSAFLLETDQPGFKITERIHTIGVQASNTVRFEMHDAVGWHTPCKFEEAISFLGKGRLGIAAMGLGIAEKAIQLTVEYASQREQFNRKLSDMQSVQNMLADSVVDLEAARLLIYKGAHLYDKKQDVNMAASMAKLFASEAVNRCTNRAIQIHGGRGMTFEYLVEKLWRDAKLTEIGEGCSEIQRLIIGKQISK